MLTFTMMKTKVLSARVTPDVYEAWQTLAKNTGKSVSRCLQDAVTVVDNSLPILKAQDGIMVPDSFEYTVLSIGGGAVTGVLVYKAVYAILSRHTQYDENELQLIAAAAGFASSICIATKINQIMK
jgi:hypothetical protein